MGVQVEPLLVALILDGQIDGHIDQLSQLLLLNKEATATKKYDALDKRGPWLEQNAASFQSAPPPPLVTAL